MRRNGYVNPGASALSPSLARVFCADDTGCLGQGHYLDRDVRLARTPSLIVVIESVRPALLAGE